MQRFKVGRMLVCYNAREDINFQHPILGTISSYDEDSEKYYVDWCDENMLMRYFEQDIIAFARTFDEMMNGENNA